MTQESATETATTCGQLLDLATPELYRRNLFRILSLHVTAAPRDVQRMEARRRIEAKLGVAAASASQGGLAIVPPPSDSDIRGAIDRMNRPVDRLLDEIFWFWPVSDDAAADEGLRRITQGQIGEAIDFWEAFLGQGARGEIAAHNLAVIYHLFALDLERRLHAGSLTPPQKAELPSLWLQAFCHWEKVFKGEEFWRAARERVRVLNDVQLTTGLVARIRDTLPTALLLITARVALAAAEGEDTESASRLASLLGATSIGSATSADALHEALLPLRERVKAASESARKAFQRQPQRGNRHVRTLHEQSVGLLAIADVLLAPTDTSRTAMHDMVGDAMLEGQVAYSKKTNDWVESIHLLELAHPLVVGAKLKEQISDNLEIVKKNAESGGDWCAPGYWELPESTIAELEAIRLEATGSKCEDAIRKLATMSPTLGKVLWRCMAFALTRRGWQITEEKLDEFTAPTANMQRFLDVIHRKGTVSVPHPEMPSHMLPECPVCSRSSYTRWANGTYKGQQFWMCSSCSSEDDSERERRKSKFKTALASAYEYYALASEIDGSDPAVKEGIGFIAKMAGDMYVSKPSTKELRVRLTKSSWGARRLELTPAEGATVCFFCRKGASSSSNSIGVPMCGELRETQQAFGSSFEYIYGEAVVPRCDACRREHASLLKRSKEWRDARAAATADRALPAASVAKERTEALDGARVAQTAAETESGAAASALKEAMRIGTRCPSCRTNYKMPAHPICTSPPGTLRTSAACDADAVLRRFGGGWTLTAILATLIPLFLPRNALAGLPLGPKHLDLLVPLVAGTSVILLRQMALVMRRRRTLAKRVLDFADAKADALKAGGERKAVADAALETARMALHRETRAHAESVVALRVAREATDAAFLRTRPQPALPAGIAPEAAYLGAPQIADLRRRGYAFGKELAPGRQLLTSPVDTRGLLDAASTSGLAGEAEATTAALYGVSAQEGGR